MLASAGAITRANSSGVSTGTAIDRGLRTVKVRRLTVKVRTARTPRARGSLEWMVTVRGVGAVMVTVGLSARG